MTKLKVFSLLLALSIIINFVPVPAQAVYDQAAGVSYLKSKPLDEWSVMALSSSSSLNEVNLDFLKSDPGNKPTDIEKKILAIVAVGQNPETFGSVNLVEKLISNFNGTEINSSLASNLLNDDIFGLLALSAANKNAQMRNQLASFIKLHQNQDGGFSFTYKGTPSDSNDTAMAIMALVSNGENPDSAAINNAFDYLASTKTSTGYSFDAISGYGPDSASTAWAISALMSTNRSVPASSLDYLKSLQNPDGSFSWITGAEGQALMTAYAVVALNNDYYPINSQNNSHLNQFQVFIKGPADTIFQGEIAFNQFSLNDSASQTHTFNEPRAIGTVSESAKKSNFSYLIRNTGLGLFVECIANICASGSSGWMYAVNGTKPNLGASEYLLNNNDKVIWFFGAPNDPVPSWPQLPANSASLALSANIISQPTPPPSIIFGIDTTNVSFGDLHAGQTSSAKAVQLTNSGSINLKISTTLQNADSVYQQGLFLDSAVWSNYQTNLDANFAKNVNLVLQIPSTYTGLGQKTGTLIFWASPR